MGEQAVCKVSYIRLKDLAIKNRELYSYQKRLAMWMLKQSFLDFFQMELKEEAVGRTSYGKPYYKEAENCYFNISHCRRAVCVAVCRYPVGIDVESMRKIGLPAVKKCCSKRELQYVFADRQMYRCDQQLSLEGTKRFLHLWTLKESYVKMTGEGIRMPLNTIDFALGVVSDRQKPFTVLKSGEKDSTSSLYLENELIMALSIKKGDIKTGREVIWQEYEKPAW